jgi:hypothetical protein
MADPDGNNFYPLLTGLAEGEKIVAAGSFLVDAETRLNPAAGSVYFGGSGGTKAPPKGASTVRPSTPPDEAGSIDAVLAKLSAEDRELVQAQRVCPILSENRLGSMGAPVKIIVQGKPVFLCCKGCKQRALETPQETLDKVALLKQSTGSSTK